MEGCSYTIEQWLQGMVDYDLPLATLRAVLYNRGISEGTEMAELDTPEGARARDLCLADIYRWLASSSSTSSGAYESDGGWQSQKSTKNVVDRGYLMREANRIYTQYGETASVSDIKGKIRIMPI